MLPAFGHAIRRMEERMADRVADEIEEFLTGSRGSDIDIDRVLATVLFTDIVDSTKRAAEVGDGSSQFHSSRTTSPPTKMNPTIASGAIHIHFLLMFGPSHS